MNVKALLNRKYTSAGRKGFETLCCNRPAEAVNLLRAGCSAVSTRTGDPPNHGYYEGRRQVNRTVIASRITVVCDDGPYNAKF